MTDFTDDERSVIRLGAFGAIAAVAKADPGFLDTFRETMAGSKVFAAAPPEIQSLLKQGGLPTPPKGNQAEVETSVLSSLSSAVSILEQKDPALAQSYRDVVIDACSQAADASKGVSAGESAMIDRVRAALS